MTLTDIHVLIHSSGQYNFASCRIPVKSSLNISVWRTYLADYADKSILDFLEFGCPINFVAERLLRFEMRNHIGSEVDKFLEADISLDE